MPSKLTKLTFAKRGEKVHGHGKYCYDNVVYHSSHIPVRIKCLTCNNWFEQAPSNHLSGQGCWRCGIRKQAISRTHDTNLFVEKSVAVHGYKYDYSEADYENSSVPVVIICPVVNHGPFSQRPAHHIGGQGCPMCGIARRTNMRRYTPERFAAISNGVHGIGTYDYSEVDYKNNRTPVIIICPKRNHRRFSQRPDNHVRGAGCPRCAAEQTSMRCRKSQLQFVTEAISVHGKGRYCYSDTKYTTDRESVVIICPVDNHGPFLQSPSNHLRGVGCPKCNQSKGEKAIYKYLESSSYPFRCQARFPDLERLSYDFLVEKDNTIYLIEYDGEQHFRYPNYFHKSQQDFEKNQQTDIAKTLYALRNGYVMIRLDYTALPLLGQYLTAALMESEQLILSNDTIYKRLIQGVAAARESTRIVILNSDQPDVHTDWATEEAVKETRRIFSSVLSAGLTEYLFAAF